MFPRLDAPAGIVPIEGARPFKVEYPYGLPGDPFRTFARPGKATCVSYHRGVDPRDLAQVRNGNGYRYGEGDVRFREMVDDMQANGFRGGDGGRVIVHVTADDCWLAEGNHRMRAALAAGVAAIEVEVRYLGNSDEVWKLIEFDPGDPAVKVVSD